MAPVNKTQVDLDIRLFGPMDVHVCGQSLPRLRSRKGLWLLALLAMRNGRAVERDWLCGALWPDDASAEARRSLRQSLHDLRLAMGQVGARLKSSTGHALSLDLAGAFVDVMAFDAAVATGDEASLEVAVSLRRGTFLEGCSEEWVLQDRLVRDREYVAALEALATAAHARANHAAQADWLRRATAEEPFREDLWRGLMRAAVAAGDPISALSTYREFREMLWHETLAQPEAETTALFRAIRDELRGRARSSAGEPSRATGPAPARPVSPAHGLPAPLTPLIGRDEDACDAAALVESARLVTLTGAGGIGKTRLAIQVARDLAIDFPDGTWFADLVGLSDPDGVPNAVRKAIGAPAAESQGESLEALARYIAGARALLVIDNCEHLLIPCGEIVEYLLRRCPQLRVLATSRRPLGLEGEALWRVPSLAFPATSTRHSSRGSPAADPHAFAKSYPAVQLFVERATASNRQFRLTQDNVDGVVDICRRLDGMPLAIELAAARVRSLSAAEICARLQEGLGLLEASGAERRPRRQTLEATFVWSWRLLDSAEQCVLRRLSVFARGWSLEAAEAVCAGGVIAAGQVVDLLSSLVDSSLVVFTSADAVGNTSDDAPLAPRYSLLETVRQYAAARLAESGDQEATRRRHRDYYLTWAEKRRAELTPSNRILLFGQFEREHDNLRNALDWSLAAQDQEELLRLAIALATFWDTRGYLREGRARLEAALAMAGEDAPAQLRGLALGHVGWIAYLQGDPAARGYLADSHAIASTSGGEDHPIMLNMMALAAANDGDFDSARELFERALAQFRKKTPFVQVAGILDNLACLELRAGNLDAARSYIEESVAQCTGAVAGTQVHGLALLDLAIVDLRQQRHQEAHLHALQSLRVLRDCAATITIPDTLSVLGLIAARQERWERATELFGAAQEMRAGMGVTPSPLIAIEVDEAVHRAEQALGSLVFTQSLATGRAMDLEDVVRQCDAQA